MTNASKSAHLYDVNCLKFPNVRRKNALMRLPQKHKINICHTYRKLFQNNKYYYTGKPLLIICQLMIIINANSVHLKACYNIKYIIHRYCINRINAGNIQLRIQLQHNEPKKKATVCVRGIKMPTH